MWDESLESSVVAVEANGDGGDGALDPLPAMVMTALKASRAHLIGFNIGFNIHSYDYMATRDPKQYATAQIESHWQLPTKVLEKGGTEFMGHVVYTHIMNGGWFFSLFWSLFSQREKFNSIFKMDFFRYIYYWKRAPCRLAFATGGGFPLIKN